LLAVVGQLEDEPRDGEGCRPGADAGDGLADEVAAEVPVVECGEATLVGSRPAGGGTLVSAEMEVHVGIVSSGVVTADHIAW
jgi:hypothetical protein